MGPHAVDPKITRMKTIKDWKQFIIFLLIALTIRSFLFSPCRVPSGSMLPTLQVGDFPILLKTTYGWSRFSLLGGGYIPYFSGKIGGKALPDRGEVVVFTNPRDTRQDIIKRVVGLPGDSVQMIGGILHLNDRPIALELKQSGVAQYNGHETVYGKIYTATLPTKGGTMSYEILKQKPFGQGHDDNTPKYYVPDQHFFVLGDNPDGSGDSREMNSLGFVHQKYLLGRPLFTYLSINPDGVSWTQPWTWLKLPFRIRWNRCLYQRIQPVFTPTPETSLSIEASSPADAATVAPAGAEAGKIPEAGTDAVTPGADSGADSGGTSAAPAGADSGGTSAAPAGAAPGTEKP